MPMTEKVTDTWIATPQRIGRSGVLEACLIHIYPTGTEMGRRYVLGTQELVFGRADGVDIRVPDNSVSRRHASIRPEANGYILVDLGSTNGTFVNDVPIQGKWTLRDGDYVRIGNCIYRFLSGGNIEAEYHEEIYRLTIIDGLTQVHNKRYLLDFLEREVARSARHKRPLSLMMMDLDHFKSINDTHGHLIGDFVIRELAERIRDRVRREDLFARYGGEEFSMVLVETALPAAISVADRIRQAISDTPFVQGAVSLPVTVSIGVACTDGNTLSSEQLIAEADAKLYEAKRAGRNRVAG